VGLSVRSLGKYVVLELFHINLLTSEAVLQRGAKRLDVERILAE
jgi:hypothetical protein